MKVNGKPWRPIWLEDDGWGVGIIDQTRLPFAFETARLETEAEAAHAIRAMLVRGAPLIGATAAYGMALAMREDASDANLAGARERLFETRPTAINLGWALDDMRRRLAPLAPDERVAAAYARAAEIVEQDVEINRRIGAHGLELIRAIAVRKSGPVNILTHCNAGWLATCDWPMASYIASSGFTSSAFSHQAKASSDRPRAERSCPRLAMLKADKGSNSFAFLCSASASSGRPKEARSRSPYPEYAAA